MLKKYVCVDEKILSCIGELKGYQTHIPKISTCFKKSFTKNVYNRKYEVACLDFEECDFFILLNFSYWGK